MTGSGILKGDVILRHGRSDLDQGSQTKNAVEHPMGRHEDAVQVGVLRHPFELGNAADITRVGTNDIHGAFFDQILEILPQIDLLARVYRGRGTLRHLPVEIRQDVWGVVPGDHIFAPHHIQGLQGLCQSDRIRDHAPRTAIQCQPHLVSQSLFHGPDAIDDVVQATLGHGAPFGAPVFDRHITV